jgi:hypothetical protein
MAARPVISSSSTMAGSPTKKEGVDMKKITEERRKFGSFSVIVPTEPKQIITAHHGEALCVRYVTSFLGEIFGMPFCKSYGQHVSDN